MFLKILSIHIFVLSAAYLASCSQETEFVNGRDLTDQVRLQGNEKAGPSSQEATHPGQAGPQSEGETGPENPKVPEDASDDQATAPVSIGGVFLTVSYVRTKDDGSSVFNIEVRNADDSALDLIVDLYTVDFKEIASEWFPVGNEGLEIRDNQIYVTLPATARQIRVTHPDLEAMPVGEIPEQRGTPLPSAVSAKPEQSPPSPVNEIVQMTLNDRPRGAGEDYLKSDEGGDVCRPVYGDQVINNLGRLNASVSFPFAIQAKSQIRIQIAKVCGVETQNIPQKPRAQIIRVADGAVISTLGLNEDINLAEINLPGLDPGNYKLVLESGAWYVNKTKSGRDDFMFGNIQLTATPL